MTGRQFFLLGSTVLVMAVLVPVLGNTVASVTAPPLGNALGYERSAEVAGDTQVGQQFTAPFPGLSRVDVGLDPSLTRNVHHLTFHLRNADSLATEDLWTAGLSTDDIQGEELHSFEFPPVRDSTGQTFYFYLQSTDSAPGDAITIRYDPASLLHDASAYVDGQPVNGNLQFQTFYTLRTQDKINILLARMTEGRPYLLGDKGFYIGLTVVYVLLLGAFLGHIAKAIQEEERA